MIASYQSTTDTYDEMLDETGAISGEVYRELYNWLNHQEQRDLNKLSRLAEDVFRRVGITFNVYGEGDGQERLIPFDTVPRIIKSSEWRLIEAGVKQRVRAINAFLFDIYHGQEILKAGIIPSSIVLNNKAFLPQMMGFTPPGNIYTHVVGTDIVRTGPNDFFVLEDNLRVPSGVSYMLENRETMLQLFPELFAKYKVRPVNNYPQQLLKSLCECVQSPINGRPVVSVLTPGGFNSAYFEHSFLADEMGAELIEGSDLVFADGRVAQRTTRGPVPIDIIYRRVDDEFIDPLSFNQDSLLGMPGLFDAYRAGKVMLANAPGAGIADDKAMYSYMPEIIRFYTGEKPILPNIHTWKCANSDELAYVLENLEELVVKEVHGSGGYGMLIGPLSSKAEIARFRKKLKARPKNYVAQPTLSLSTVPILTRAGLAPRRVDLRPFSLVSPRQISVTAGGLTRVALRKNSLVVNSSQGGGTKDTWVVEE